MFPTTVVNIRHDDYDVYCARGGLWGNPFTIPKDGDRGAVIVKYREWIKTQPGLLAMVPILKGKRLGCFCHPKPCHCDILAELADALPVAAPVAAPVTRTGRIFDLSSKTHLDIRNS